MKIKYHYNKNPDIFAFINLVKNVVFIPKYIVEALQDDISSTKYSHMIALHCSFDDFYVLLQLPGGSSTE